MSKIKGFKMNLQRHASPSGLTTELGGALAINFVETFGQKMKTLEELLGVQRVLPMASGTLIKTYTSSVTLAGGAVAPGELIPLSEVVREPGPTQELVWDKRRKAVPMEKIQSQGYESAIINTDTQLVNAVQKEIRTKLLAQLATGTGTAGSENLQGILAENWASITETFDEDDVDVVSFINPFDATEYLAKANISTQSAFGMTYLQDFLSNKIVFMSAQIPKGTVYSTASANLVLAYADMKTNAAGEVFGMATDSTGIIGVTHHVDKETLTVETITGYGIVLFAERLDGIVVGTITPAA